MRYHIKKELKINPKPFDLNANEDPNEEKLDIDQIRSKKNVVHNEIKISRETQKLMKTSKLTEKPIRENTKKVTSNLAIELEDPANEELREDIQRIIHLGGDLVSLENEFDSINQLKNEMEQELLDCKKKDFDKKNKNFDKKLLSKIDATFID